MRALFDQVVGPSHSPGGLRPRGRRCRHLRSSGRGAVPEKSSIVAEVVVEEPAVQPAPPDVEGGP